MPPVIGLALTGAQVFQGGLPQVRAAAPLADDKVQPSGYQLAASGFPIVPPSLPANQQGVQAIEGVLPTLEKNGWRSKAQNLSVEGNPYTLGTCVIQSSTRGLVYTLDIAPIMEGVVKSSGESKNATQEYLKVLHLLVNRQTDYQSLGFPSQDSYLFAVAETLARIDQLTHADAGVIGKRSGGVQAYIESYAKASEVLKAAGYQKMPAEVLRAWSGEIVIAYSAPGQATKPSEVVESLKSISKVERAKAYIEHEMKDVLSTAQIKLDDIIEGKMSEEALVASPVSQPLILAVQNASDEVRKTYWYFPELNDAATGFSQGGLSGAVAAGILNPKSSLRTVAIDGRVMSDSEPYKQGDMPMLSVMGMTPDALYEMCQDVSLHLNFLKGLDIRNTLIPLFISKGIITEGEVAQLTQALDQKVVGELTKQFQAQLVSGQFLPIREMAKDENLRKKFPFLKIVHAADLETLFSDGGDDHQQSQDQQDEEAAKQALKDIIQNAGLGNTQDDQFLESSQYRALTKYAWLFMDRTFDFAYPKLDGQMPADRQALSGYSISQVVSASRDAALALFGVVSAKRKQDEKRYGSKEAVPEGVKVALFPLAVTQPFHTVAMQPGWAEAVAHMKAVGEKTQQGHARLYLNSMSVPLDEVMVRDDVTGEYRKPTAEEEALIIIAEQNKNGVFFSEVLRRMVADLRRRHPGKPIVFFDGGPSTVHARGHLAKVLEGLATVVCQGTDKDVDGVYGFEKFTSPTRAMDLVAGSLDPQDAEPIEKQTGKGSLPRYRDAEGNLRFTGSVGYLNTVSLDNFPDADEITRRVNDLTEVGSDHHLHLKQHPLQKRWDLDKVVGLAGMTGPGTPKLVGAVAREGGTAALAAGNFPPSLTPHEPELWHGHFRGLIETALETTRRFDAQGKLDGGEMYVYCGPERKRYLIKISNPENEALGRDKVVAIADDGSRLEFELRDFNDVINPGKVPTESWAKFIQSIRGIAEVDLQSPRMKTFGANIMHQQAAFNAPMVQAILLAKDMGLPIGFITAGLYVDKSEQGMLDSLLPYVALLARGISLVPLLPSPAEAKKFEESHIPHLQNLLKDYFSKPEKFSEMLRTSRYSLLRTERKPDVEWDARDRAAYDRLVEKMDTIHGLKGALAAAHERFMAHNGHLFTGKPEDALKAFYEANPSDLLFIAATEDCAGGGHNNLHTGVPGKDHIAEINKDGGKTHKIVTGGMTRPADIADAKLAGQGPKGMDVVSAQVGTAFGMTEASGWPSEVQHSLYRAASFDPKDSDYVFVNIISEFEKTINCVANVEGIRSGKVSSFAAAMCLLEGEQTLGVKGLFQENKVDAKRVLEIMATEPQEMIKFRYAQWKEMLKKFYAFFDARFLGQLELFDKVWQSLLNPNDKKLREVAVKALDQYINIPRLKDEKDEAYFKRRQDRTSNVRRFFVEFRTQNAQIPNLNPDWVYVLGGMSIQNLPEEWIKNYFAACEYGEDGRVTKYGRRFTVKELVDHLHTGTERYLEELAIKAGQAWWKTHAGRDMRGMHTVKGLDVEVVPGENGQMTVNLEVVDKVDRNDMIDALRKQGAGALAALLQADRVHSDVSENFVTNRLIDFIRPQKGRRYELVMRNQESGAPILESIRFYDEVRGDTDAPFLFAEAKISGDGSVSLRVNNPTHHLDPSHGEPIVGHYEFSLKPRFDNGPLQWYVDVRQYQKDSMAMLYRALLGRDMTSYEERTVDSEYHAKISFNESVGLKFNQLVAAAQANFLDIRSPKPIALHVFGVAAQALAGGIEAQSHPESGVADVTKLLHEGIDIRISPEADLTLRRREQKKDPLEFDCVSRLSGVENDGATGGLRKQTFTAVTQNGKPAFEIHNSTIILDPEAQKPAADLNERLSGKVSEKIALSEISHEVPEASRAVVWEAASDLTLSRQVIRQYGKIDANVFHHWDLLAESAGQDKGIIAQGMLSAAMMFSQVVEGYFGGSIEDIRRIKVKFEGKALPEDGFRVRLVRKGWTRDGHEVFEAQLITLQSPNLPIVRMEITARGPERVEAVAGQAFEDVNMFEKGRAAFTAAGDLTDSEKERFKKGLDAYNGFVDLADEFVKKNIGFDLQRVVRNSPKLIEFTVQDPLGLWVKDRHGVAQYYAKGQKVVLEETSKGVLYHALVRQIATVTAEVASFLGRRAMGIPESQRFIVSSLGLTAATIMSGVFGDKPEEMVKGLLVALDRAVGIGLVGGQFGLVKGACFKDTQKLCEEFNAEYGQGKDVIWATNENTATTTGIGSVDLQTMEKFEEFVAEKNKGNVSDKAPKVEVDKSTPFAFHSAAMDPAAKLAEERLQRRLGAGQFPIYDARKIAGRVHLDARQGALATKAEDPIQEIVYQINHSVHVMPSIKKAHEAAKGRRVLFTDGLSHKKSVAGMVDAYRKGLKSGQDRVMSHALGEAEGQVEILGHASKSIELRPLVDPRQKATVVEKPQTGAQVAAAPQNAPAVVQAPVVTTGFGRYLKEEDAASKLKSDTDVAQIVLDATSIFLGRSDVTADKNFGALGIDTTKGPQLLSVILERFGISPQVADKVPADSMSSLIDAMQKLMAGSTVNYAYAALNPLWSKVLPQGHIQNLETEANAKTAVDHIVSFGPGVLPLIDQVLREKVKSLKVEFTADAKKRVPFFEKALLEAKEKLLAVKKEMEASQKGGGGADLDSPEFKAAVTQLAHQEIANVLGLATDDERAIRLADGSVAVPMSIDRKGQVIPRSEAEMRRAADELAKIKANTDPEYIKSMTSGVWSPSQLEGWKDIEMNGAIDALNEFAVTLREAIGEGKYNYERGQFRDALFQQWVEWKLTHLANQMGDKSMSWLSQMIEQYNIGSDRGKKVQNNFNPGGLYTPVAQLLMTVYEKAMTEVSEPDGSVKPIFQTKQILANGVDPLTLVNREVRLLHGLPDPVEVVPTGETIDEFYEKAQKNNWLSGQLLDEVNRLRRGEVKDLTHVRALILAGTSTAAKPLIAFLISKGAKVRLSSTRHFSDVQAEFRDIFQKYAVRGAEMDVAWNFSFNPHSVIQLVNQCIDDGFVPNVFANAGAVEDYLPFNMPTANGSPHSKDHFENVMNALVKTTTYSLRYISQRYLELGLGVQVQWLNFHSPAADGPLPGSNTYPYAKAALALDTVDNTVRTERLHYADGTPVIFATHLEIGATLPAQREAGKIMSGQVKEATEMQRAIRAQTGVETTSFWAEQMGLHLGAMVSLGQQMKPGSSKSVSHRQHSVGGFNDEKVMGKVGDLTSAYPDIVKSVREDIEKSEKALTEALEQKHGKRTYALDEVLEAQAALFEKEGRREEAQAYRERARTWKETRRAETMSALNHAFAFGHTQRLVGDNAFFIDGQGVNTFDSRRHRRNHTSDDDLVVIAAAGTNSGGKYITDATRAVLAKRGLDLAGGMPWAAMADVMKGEVRANDGSNKVVGVIRPYADWSSLTDQDVAEQKRLIRSNIGMRTLGKLIANVRQEPVALEKAELIEINADDKGQMANFRQLNEFALREHKESGKEESTFVPPYQFYQVLSSNGEAKSYVSVKKHAQILADVVGRLRVTMFADLPDNFFENLTGVDKEEIIFQAITTVFARLTTTQLTDMMGLSLPNLHLKFGAYLLDFFVGTGMVDNAGKNLLESGSLSDVGNDAGKGVIRGIGNSRGSSGTQQLGVGGQKRNLSAACATGLEVIYNAVERFAALKAEADAGLVSREEYYSTVIYGLSMEYGALASTQVGFDALGPEGAMTRDEFSAKHGRRGSSTYAPHDMHRDGFLAGVGTSGLVVTTRKMARMLGQAPLVEIVGATATSDFHQGYDGGKDPRAETAPGFTGQALLNWMLHGIIEQKGFTRDDVSVEVSHSTGTGGDPKQAIGLRSSERARQVKEQALAFEMALKSIMELGHTLGGTMMEAVQAIVLFTNGIIPGHLALNNITPEQHARLATALSRIHLKFSGHIRPMTVSDLMLVYNFGFHSENRAAALTRGQMPYGSLNEALLTQKKMKLNRAQQASNFVAAHRQFGKDANGNPLKRADIASWDAELADTNRYSTPKFIRDNAQILAEMEVYENLYQHDDALLDHLYSQIHGRERSPGEGLFGWQYENLDREIKAYNVFKARLKAGTDDALRSFRLITEEDWTEPKDKVQIDEELGSLLGQLGVPQAWAQEYIADRQSANESRSQPKIDQEMAGLLTRLGITQDELRDYLTGRAANDNRDSFDYFLDFMGAFTSKIRFYGGIEFLAQWHEETSRLRFDVKQLNAKQKQAVGLFIAHRFLEVMREKSTPQAVSVSRLVNQLVRQFPTAVTPVLTLEGMVVSRFGGLRRRHSHVQLPQPTPRRVA